MGKALKVAGGLAALLFVSPLAVASELEVGATWFDFEYEEQGTDGAVLNKESGDVPGLYLAWQPGFGELVWGRLEAGYASHSVAYDGQTQAGAPLATTTHQRLIHYDGRLGLHLYQGRVAWRPYLAARYQRWDRAIQPTSLSLGLDEDYRWWEAGAGLQACALELSWAAELCLDLQGFRTVSGEVEVGLDSLGAENPTLALGDSDGFRTQLTWSPRPWPRLGLAVFYEQWSFGRSNTETVTLGTAVLRVTEPASDTVRQGLRAFFRF